MGQGGLDQRFAVRPRIESGGTEMEIETPKFAAAENSGNRLAAAAPRQRSFKRGDLRFVEFFSGMDKDGFGRNPCGEAQKQAGFPAGIVDVGKGQTPGGFVQRLDDGHESSASLAAWSSAISASTISSNASPVITLSIL